METFVNSPAVTDSGTVIMRSDPSHLMTSSSTRPPAFRMYSPSAHALRSLQDSLQGFEWILEGLLQPFSNHDLYKQSDPEGSGAQSLQRGAHKTQAVLQAGGHKMPD